ncbi:hypothetical protein T310_0162 [Rasamsonia emersonii CBS 393.64]|uniref:Uncharacterized protein n=1 Tax=Rasamsonia emersonii (strain ATCC 16479 / CBS 393.64 / IMI 116815) TaxID=1408163 RepID=A0A0F4Z6Q8_RASE3|nr:hypothetical protein T310_0162 [Rasamsonia emersonii CBS 393.64]KKA25776.1 hypothetical protein T310_0162 [Rasamsonia emersonii CBS 393.64]
MLIRSLWCLLLDRMGMIENRLSLPSTSGLKCPESAPALVSGNRKAIMAIKHRVLATVQYSVKKNPVQSTESEYEVQLQTNHYGAQPHDAGQHADSGEDEKRSYHEWDEIWG